MQAPLSKELNIAQPTSRTTNSPYDMLARGEGVQVSKSITCDGNGAQTDNIFSVTGAVKILQIWAEVTQVTNGTVFSDNYLDLYDSTAAVELTDSAAGLDLSGAINAGGILLKNGASASAALAKLNCDVGTVLDTMAVPVYVIKKTGAATYIRHCFTGNADTNVAVTWYVRYVKMSSDGALAAV